MIEIRACPACLQVIVRIFCARTYVPFGLLLNAIGDHPARQSAAPSVPSVFQPQYERKWTLTPAWRCDGRPSVIHPCTGAISRTAGAVGLVLVAGAADDLVGDLAGDLAGDLGCGKGAGVGSCAPSLASRLLVGQNMPLVVAQLRTRRLLQPCSPTTSVCHPGAHLHRVRVLSLWCWGLWLQLWLRLWLPLLCDGRESAAFWFDVRGVVLPRSRSSRSRYASSTDDGV